jgi:hypothetical protein
MKKLILGVALMLAFAGTAIAQTDNKVQTTTPATSQPAVTDPATTAPATDPAAATPVTADPAMTATPAQAAQQEPAPTVENGKEFTKVTQSQISQAVLKKAVAKYKDYALVEALAATDGSEFKLVLTKDGKDVAAYYKANGEFIKEETV